MARRQPYVKRPRCPHMAALWNAYDAASERRWTWNGSGDRPPDPIQPEADGYCEECRRALFQPGAVWPAEVWAFLNAQAANDYAGRHPRLTFPKLPAAPRPRKEPAAKHRARLRDAYTLKPREQDPSCDRVIGRPTPDGYHLTATNGHCALLERGAGNGDLLKYKGWQASDQWIDLPADFHLALTRVAILANERSHCITLELQGPDLIIGTRGYEADATERVQVLSATVTRPAIVRLNAEYLDPVCGVWPLRWYMRGADDPQLFAPGGEAADYRAVIMPMRQ